MWNAVEPYVAHIFTDWPLYEAMKKALKYLLHDMCVLQVM